MSANANTNFNLRYILVNRLLRLLGALAQGLDELLHGGARDEGPHDPPTLLQPHPHNLPNKVCHYKLKAVFTVKHDFDAESNLKVEYFVPAF